MYWDVLGSTPGLMNYVCNCIYCVHTGRGGAGGLQPATQWQQQSTHSGLSSWAGPTRRLPVRCAAVVFHEETTATSQIPCQGSRPGAGPSGGPSKLGPGEFSHENFPPFRTTRFHTRVMLVYGVDHTRPGPWSNRCASFRVPFKQRMRCGAKADPVATDSR
jgi:hypothetical protein